MNNIHEDKQQLQSIIQSIGNAVVTILPNTWSKVVVGYFIAGKDQFPHLQLHAITDCSDDYTDLMEQAWDLDEMDGAITEIQRLCEKMRRLCMKANDCWTMMTFCLQADGSFNIDYGYEPIEEYNTDYILTWQSQYLD